MRGKTKSRRRFLRALLWKDCAAAILTEVHDGVENRLEDLVMPALTDAESAWLHEEIGLMADQLCARAWRLEKRDTSV